MKTIAQQGITLNTKKLIQKLKKTEPIETIIDAVFDKVGDYYTPKGNISMTNEEITVYTGEDIPDDLINDIINLLAADGVLIVDVIDGGNFENLNKPFTSNGEA